MNKIVFFLSFISLYFSTTVAASTDWADRGNGGDVIVCNGGERMMYDPYEAEMRYDLKPQYPLVSPVDDETEPIEERKWAMTVAVAQKLIDRLQKLDRSRWEKYSRWLQTFKEEARFVDNAELFDVPDTGIGFIPPGCVLKQLVIQREPKFIHDRRYIVAMDYWFWLQPEDAAAGVIHELLYRELISVRPEVRTSESLRYFNALILSNEIGKMSVVEYYELTSRIF